jgi:hypothetical protein
MFKIDKTGMVMAIDCPSALFDLIVGRDLRPIIAKHSFAGFQPLVQSKVQKSFPMLISYH